VSDPTPEQILEARDLQEHSVDANRPGGVGLSSERIARALAERDRRIAAEKMAVKHLRRQVAERDARIAELEGENERLNCALAASGVEPMEMRDLEAKLAAVREMLTRTCPCCEESLVCLDGCTFAEDCPVEYEELMERRRMLEALDA
jgi:hypothetical protein